MPPRRQPLIPKICPDCGAEDSVVLDEHEGVIVCDECGIVLKGGLEEAEESAYHDDQVTSRSGQQILHGSGRANAQEKLSAAETFANSVTQYIASLKTRLDVPEAVSTEAKAVLPDFLATLPDNQPRPQPTNLAVALFHIASYVQHYPISIKQCTSQLRIGHQGIKDLAGLVITNLKIQLPAPEKTLADLVSVLLEKLRIQPAEPMMTMASALAGTFDKAVTSSFEPRIVAAVSLFLCSWAKSIREQLAPRVCAFLNAKSSTSVIVEVPVAKAWTEEEKTHLEKKLTALIGDEDNMFRSCVRHLSTKKEFVPQWVAATAGKFPKVELKEESGARRERE